MLPQSQAAKPGGDISSIHWNGEANHWFDLVCLRSTDEGLFPVVQCRYCGHMYRESWSAVLDFITDPELKARLLHHANCTIVRVSKRAAQCKKVGLRSRQPAPLRWPLTSRPLASHQHDHCGSQGQSLCLDRRTTPDLAGARILAGTQAVLWD